MANPISLVSRWKILDNLRRSLVEPATFLLLLFDWLVPGERALRWTLATVLILIIPSWFEFAFALVRAVLPSAKCRLRVRRWPRSMRRTSPYC